MVVGGAIEIEVGVVLAGQNAGDGAVEEGSAMEAMTTRVQRLGDRSRLHRLAVEAAQSHVEDEPYKRDHLLSASAAAAVDTSAGTVDLSVVSRCDFPGETGGESWRIGTHLGG